MTKFIFATCIALASLAANAHSGRTDTIGCHTDSRTGVYHCH